MIDITATAKGNGLWEGRAVIDGAAIEVTGAHNPVHELAREIVAAGYPDQPWRFVFQDGRVRMSGYSIYRMAQLTLSERATGIARETWRNKSWSGAPCSGCGERQYMFKGRCLNCLDVRRAEPLSKAAE